MRANGGGSGPNNVALSITGLPVGATPFWSTNPISFSGSGTIDVTLQLLVQNNTKVPVSPTFTVTATEPGGTNRSGNGTLTINPLAITGNITAQDKVYNATTAATILTRTLTGVLFSDNVTYSGGTATFANKNVGTGKIVTATGLSLTGPDAANYTVNSSATTIANISAFPITGNITAANKIYNGTTAATISTRTLSGVFSGDNVTYTGGSATFNDKNVGIGKPVNATGLTLSGTDAGNYTVNSSAATTANITPLAITVNFTAENKVYDGSSTATILTRTLTGVIGGDDVSGSGGIANFKTVKVGNGIEVTGINFTLSGTDAANYTVNTTATTSADITPKLLTVTITAADKTYDGTADATILTYTLNGVLGTDVVSYTGGDATFDNKNIGIDKLVTAINFGLTGSDRTNYTVTPTATTTADITAKALSVLVTAANKIYDGTTTAILNTASLSGVVSGDIVVLNSAGATAVFANKNVGTGKPVTVSGYTISGADAGNYSLTQPGPLSANITAKGLTILNVTANDKIYDGNTTASLNTGPAALSGVIAGDDITLNIGGATGAFASKTVANNKPVTVTGITISGADAGNYTLAQPAGLTADITAKSLTINNVLANNKVYNGNTIAILNTATAALSGVISGDAVTLNS